MKRIYALRFLLLLSFFSLALRGLKAETDFKIFTGYRCDHLKWKALELSAQTDISVDQVLTELNFTKQNIALIGGEAKFIDSCLYAKARGDYGWIINNHHVKESLIALHRDTSPGSTFAQIATLQTKAHVKGYVGDFSAAIGYPLESACGQVFVAPLIGYSYAEQTFKIHDSIPALLISSRGHFKTLWHGPWIGADMNVALTSQWSIFGEIEYHYLMNKRTLSSSLSLIPVNAFLHKHYCSTGQGIYLKAGTHFNWCGWILGLDMVAQYSHVRHQRERINWGYLGGNVSLGCAF